jgi:hypothetical protein
MTEQGQTASRNKAEAKRKSTRKKASARKRLGRVIDRGTENVERFHRAIAGWPLDALERVERLEAPVARVRKLQDRSITATYELVRGLNREVVRLVRESSGERSPKPRRRHSKRSTPHTEPHLVAQPKVVTGT